MTWTSSTGLPGRRNALRVRLEKFVHGRLSLVVVLGSAFGLFVLVSVGSVLAINLSSAGQSTRGFIEEKARLMLATLEQRLRQRLEPVQSQAQFLSSLIDRGLLDPNDPVALKTALRSALSATPQVIDIAFITTDLRGVRISRQDGAAHEENWAGRPDVVSRIKAARSDGPMWRAPFWSPTLKETVMLYTAPVRRGGAVIGAISSMVSTAELSRYVAELSQPNEKVFILYGDDRVFAHPNLTGRAFRGSADHPLPSLEEVGDPVVAGLFDPALHPIRLLKGDDGSYRASLPIGDYIYIYRNISGFGQVRWSTMVALPAAVLESEFARLRLTAIGSLVLMGLAVAVAILLAHRIAKPITAFAALANQIGTLELDQAPRFPRSRIKEFDRSGHALNAMTAALRWFELYLPRTLVRRLLAHGDNHLQEPSESEVTIMFTDMGGFSELAFALGPRETAALLNEHFRLLGACIEAEGGTIDKYVGDSLMAFWGAPDEQQDHALRACRAAHAITRAIQTNNRNRWARGTKPIHMRIGIATGVVLVGNIGAPGRINYTVVGDVVNIAERLEQLGKEIARDDETVILISDTTLQHTAGEFEMVGAGAHTLRGRAKPILVHRLLDLTPVANENSDREVA